VLADQIEQLELKYADQNETGRLIWRNHWNLDGKRKETPLAVMCIVQWRDGSWESWLRRVAGAGEYERPPGWRPQIDSDRR